jgi:hypothetical protein
MLQLARKRQSLEEWIKEAISDPDKSEPCRMIALVHIAGQFAKEIHSKDVGTAFNTAEAARVFQSKAENYCQDMPGRQKFALRAFYGTNPEPVADHPFHLQGAHTYGANDETEPPDARGEKMQGMRHQEMMTQLAYNQCSRNFDNQARLADRLAEANEKLLMQNFECMTALMNMMQLRITEQHENRMKEAQYQRETTERAKWFSFAPALLNMVLGKEVFPQSTADTALIESIADNLTEDQIQKLAATLPPEVLGPVMHRVGQYLEKKERIEKAKQIGAGDPAKELG